MITAQSIHKWRCAVTISGMLWTVLSMQIIQRNASTSSVMFEWQLMMLNLSIVRVTTVDISCSTSTTDSHFMTITKTYVVRENITGTMTHVPLDGLYKDTIYNCCMTIHYLRTLPLEYKVKSCSSLKTSPLLQLLTMTQQLRGDLIGMGAALSVVVILLTVFIISTATRFWCKQNQ